MIEGRTVFVSSHLMSEMSLTAGRLVIIGRGRLLAQATIQDLLGGGLGTFVRVRSPQAGVLATLLGARGAAVARQADGALRVSGATIDAVGELARANGFTLRELSLQQASLEERYMELTREAADHRTAGGALAPQVRPVTDASPARQASWGPLPRLSAILRAELCKLRPVRSTWWTLSAAVACNVGLAALLAAVLPGRLSDQEQASIDSVRLSLGGLHLSQIAFGLLGVLVITSEYGTRDDPGHPQRRAAPPPAAGGLPSAIPGCCGR